MWNIKHSSLTSLEPIDVIIDYSVEHSSTLSIISNLAHNIPDFIEDRRIREELICGLRNNQDILKLIDFSKNNYINERLFQIYCYFANSYVNALYENQSNKIPFEIAFPLIKISKKIKRKPFLSYHSYCLYNCRKKNNLENFSIENLQITQRFTKDQQEDEFIFSLLMNQIKFDQIIKKIINNTHINYKYLADLLLDIYNFMNNINIRSAPEKFKIIMKPYKLQAENCSVEIHSYDKIFFICVLETLFRDNSEIEKYNIPNSHYKFLEEKVAPINKKFNNYMRNETKYNLCQDSLSDLMLSLTW